MNRTTSFLPVAALLAGLLVGCNEHPLTPLDDTLLVTAIDITPRIGSSAVDVLWVIDNSGSMSEEQEELGDRFDEFVGALADLEADFHMAVITTDIEDGGLFQIRPGRVKSTGCTARSPELAYCDNLRLDDRFLDAASYQETAADGSVQLRTDDLAADFRCLATVGDCGGQFERGLTSLDVSLSDELRRGSNAGFLRDDAFLLVIFLTDEEDCSNLPGVRVNSEADCYVAETASTMVPVQGIFDSLVELKGAPDRILIAGIIGDDDRLPRQTRAEYDQAGGGRVSCSSQLSEAFAYDGERYRELIELAGGRGVEESICQGSFAGALANIGQILRQNLGVNCLNQEPRTCERDSDCVDGVACIQPGDLLAGDSYCADFELAVDVLDPGASQFRNIPGPGPAGEAVPYADADFIVDYDALGCLYNISFGFAPGARPVTNSRFRASYPRSTDVVRAGVDDTTGQ